MWFWQRLKISQRKIKSELKTIGALLNMIRISQQGIKHYEMLTKHLWIKVVELYVNDKKK